MIDFEERGAWGLFIRLEVEDQSNSRVFIAKVQIGDLSACASVRRCAQQLGHLFDHTLHISWNMHLEASISWDFIGHLYNLYLLLHPDRYDNEIFSLWPPVDNLTLWLTLRRTELLDHHRAQRLL